MKKLTVLLIALLPLTPAMAGRAGSVSREGPNGGSVEAQGVKAGRYSSGSVSAQGPNGGTYDASATKVGRYSTGSVNAQGPNGGSVSKSASSWNGYRSGYVYNGGVYRSATVVVNTAYLAPIGVYAGWSVIARPYYVTYPVYATYPVQVSVQVELTRRGYYGGPIDGDIGPQTQQSIARYQADNGLPPNGQINQALLKSLNIT